MKKILVVGMTNTAGGVESFLFNYYKSIDKNLIQFDFLCLMEEPVVYERELRFWGAHLFYTSSKRKKPVRQYLQLSRFFKLHANEYVALWANLNSLANINFLKMAKAHGINRIIVHSHNSANMGGKLQLILHNLNKRKIGNIATDYYACSIDAGKWFYTEEILPEVKIIKNAIDVKAYLFDSEKRYIYRKMYGLEGKKILGHIGRLHFQKNQEFLLEIMSSLVKTDDTWYLVFVGTGPEQSKLEEKVKILGLKQHVLFAGHQKDIKGWLSAFDVFGFPSKFEGLSIVALEAQANGIPIVASESAINNMAQINPNISILSLNLPVFKWCDSIINSLNTQRISSEMVIDNFKKANFEISSEAEKLTCFFEEL